MNKLWFILSAIVMVGSLESVQAGISRSHGGPAYSQQQIESWRNAIIQKILQDRTKSSDQKKASINYVKSLSPDNLKFYYDKVMGQSSSSQPSSQGISNGSSDIGAAIAGGGNPIASPD